MIKIIQATLILLFISFSASAEINNEQKTKLASLIQQADNLCDAEQYTKSQDLLKEAAAIDPENPDIYRIFGCTYSRQKSWIAAEKQYSEWARLAPDDYQAFSALGYVSRQQENYQISNQYYAKAKQLNPTNADIMQDICYNFSQLKQWNDAIKECSEAIDINPKDSYSYELRSRAYEETGEHEKAKQDAANIDNDEISEMRKEEHRFILMVSILAAITISPAVIVMIRKRPFLIQQRWLTIILSFPAAFMMGSVAPHGGKLIFLFFTILLLANIVPFIVKNWEQNYVAICIKERDFRKALLSVLNELNLKYTEEVSLLNIEATTHEAQSLQIGIRFSGGLISMKNKEKGSNATFNSIIEKLKTRFNAGDLEIDYKYVSVLAAQGVFIITMIGTLYTIGL